MCWCSGEEEALDPILRDLDVLVLNHGVNPGGDRPNRRWNPDNYAFVADQLIENLDSQVVLLGGVGEENITRYIKNKMKNDVVNLAGKLTLNDLVYVIGRFDLLITNDSGPMHIGAAVGTRLVAVFGPEDPVLMREYGTPIKIFSL